jgi:hypothetical protein
MSDICGGNTATEQIWSILLLIINNWKNGILISTWTKLSATVLDNAQKLGEDTCNINIS